MNTSVRVLSVVAAFAMTATAAAADVIKVGVIGTMSGPFALFGQNFKMGIDAWVAQHGTKVGDHQVEFVYRDEESPNPAKSKALAQELLVKEKVQYLAGLYFTPDALAIAPLLEESKTPLVVLNAATSAIVEKSPYIVRTSFTMWQNTVPAAEVAGKNGSKKVAIAVSDYGPGIDAAQQQALSKALERKLKRSVRLHCETDPTLIGGAVLRAGDTVIDGSLLSRLKRIAFELTA